MKAAGGRRPALGVALVLAAAVLWGTLGLFGKALYRYGLSPIELASARATLGFLGLAAWAAAGPSRIRVPLRDLPFFAAYGIGAFALFETLYFATVARTTVAVAAALLYTAPAFVVVLSRFLEDEPLGAPQLGALALVLAGVFLVTGAARALLTGGAALAPATIAMGLGSGLLYGVYTLFSKRALRNHDPMRASFWVFAFAAPAMAFAAPPWRIAAHTPAAALPLLLALGALPTLAAFVLYLAGLRHLRAGTASMLATAEPVVAAVLGAALLGESLAPERVLGIALIVAAALLLARASRSSPAGGPVRAASPAAAVPPTAPPPAAR